MRKVLIITYYWPPAGGPGVQRVLKFAKYLPELGWQPIILTVKNGEYPAIDETLAEDIPECCKVFKTNSIEPNFLYKRFTGMKPDEKLPVAVLAEKDVNWKKGFANWIRLNLFIPDAKIGWKPFGVREGKKIIEREKPELIFSSSPPPTVHLIAKKLARWSGIKWVADFRDPWTDTHYYEYVHRSKITHRLDRKLEKRVLQAASVVTSISRTYIFDYRNRVPQDKYVFLPNGFDGDDFQGFDFSKRSSKFCIMHLGTMGKERNPKIVFKVLSDLIETDGTFKQEVSLTLIGFVGEAVQREIDRYDLHPIVRQIPYLPHSKALKYMAEATILLLPITNTRDNKGILTGKMFEYLGTRKPILGYGHPHGEAAQIIQQTATGCFLTYDDYEGTKQFLVRSYSQWKRQEPFSGGDISMISTFERKHLTKHLAQIFEDLIQPNSDREALKS